MCGSRRRKPESSSRPWPDAPHPAGVGCGLGAVPALTRQARGPGPVRDGGFRRFRGGGCTGGARGPRGREPRGLTRRALRVLQRCTCRWRRAPAPACTSRGPPACAPGPCWSVRPWAARGTRHFLLPLPTARLWLPGPAVRRPSSESRCRGAAARALGGLPARPRFRFPGSVPSGRPCLPLTSVAARGERPVASPAPCFRRAPGRLCALLWCCQGHPPSGQSPETAPGPARVVSGEH